MAEGTDLPNFKDEERANAERLRAAREGRSPDLSTPPPYVGDTAEVERPEGGTNEPLNPEAGPVVTPELGNLVTGGAGSPDNEDLGDEREELNDLDDILLPESDQPANPEENRD